MLIPLDESDHAKIGEFLNRVFYYPLDFMPAGAIEEWIALFTRGYEILTRLARENPEILPLDELANRCLNLSDHSKMMYYTAQTPVREMLTARGICARAFLSRISPLIDNWTPPKNIPHKKIQLGVYMKVFAPYTETFASLPFFLELNPKKFAVTVYVDVMNDSPLAQNFIARGGKIVQLNGHLWEKLFQLRNANIDILLITSNTSAIVNEAFIFGLFRAARKQLVQFCQPYTTGLPHVDGFIVGNDLNVRADDFSEKLYYVDGAGICFSAGSTETAVFDHITRANMGIADSATVFVSGANYFKIREELLDFWARLLSQAPNTMLVLFPFGPAWSNEYPVANFIERVNSICRRYGVDPTRIVISKQLPRRSDIRNLISLCDIYLDSFPYSGATSLLDPFTLNMPIVAMGTPTVCGGQGAGMLRECGLNDLVANNETEYLEICLRLLNDENYRQSIRERTQQIMQNNPPFHDLKTFANKVAKIYEQVFSEI